MQAPFFASAQVFRVILPDMLRAKDRHFQLLALQSPVAYFPWPACTMYCSNRWALRGLLTALKQDVYGTNIDIVPIVVGESDTGYWDANPGSRDYVPCISSIIPTYSSADVAAITFRAAALQKTEVHENVQIALLIWMVRSRAEPPDPSAHSLPAAGLLHAGDSSVVLAVVPDRRPHPECQGGCDVRSGGCRPHRGVRDRGARRVSSRTSIDRIAGSPSP
jgi:hypothetical protein